VAVRRHHRVDTVARYTPTFHVSRASVTVHSPGFTVRRSTGGCVTGTAAGTVTWCHFQRTEGGTGETGSLMYYSVLHGCSCCWWLQLLSSCLHFLIETLPVMLPVKFCWISHQPASSSTAVASSSFPQ
jgi:hypothetical protein